MKVTMTTETSTIYTVHLSTKHFASSIVIIPWIKFYYPYFIEVENEDREKLYDNKASKGNG